MWHGPRRAVPTASPGPRFPSPAPRGVVGAAAATYDHGMSDAKPFPPQRPSASHAASRQAEIARVQRMTVEERVKAALGMAERFAGLQPAPRKE